MRVGGWGRDSGQFKDCQYVPRALALDAQVYCWGLMIISRYVFNGQETGLGLRGGGGASMILTAGTGKV